MHFSKFQLILFSNHYYTIPTKRPDGFYKIQLFVQIQLPGIDSILWVCWRWVSLNVETKSNFEIAELNVTLTSLRIVWCLLSVDEWLQFIPFHVNLYLRATMMLFCLRWMYRFYHPLKFNQLLKRGHYKMCLSIK